MRSKIKFHLGDSNREIVSATIVKTSDDVRDRIANGFIENLGYESNLCEVRKYFPAEGEVIMDLYPVNFTKIDQVVDVMSPSMRQRLKKSLDEWFYPDGEQRTVRALPLEPADTESIKSK